MTTPTDVQERIKLQDEAFKGGGREAVDALHRKWKEEDATAVKDAAWARVVETGKRADERAKVLEKARKAGGEVGYEAKRKELDAKDLAEVDAKRLADRTAAEQAVKDRDEAALKAEVLQVWLRNGGTQAEFEKEWPNLRVEAIRRKTLDAMTVTPDHLAQGLSNF